MSNILLLEDDALLGETIVDLLDDENYRVSHYLNGQDAMDAIYENRFDLYILDINVPLIDGITLLAELRESDDNTPAIFLTSHKDKSRIHTAFEAGGDDYITKPFDNDELLFRIKAILKRVSSKTPKCINLLCHDEEHKSISYDKKELELSNKEYLLLKLLMTHVDKVVPKESILDTLYNSSESGSDGAIRVYLNRIKHLLPQMKIENSRGIGYKLLSNNE